MKHINAMAEFCAMPDSFGSALIRWAVLIPMIFCIVLLDDYFRTSAFAAMFGYGLGSLTTYGSMRRLLNQQRSDTEKA